MQRVSISHKIWAVLAVIFGGYLIVMIQGHWVYGTAQARNDLVSEHFFPATLQAHKVHTIFKDQLEELEDALLAGNPQHLAHAERLNEKITSGLDFIAATPGVPTAFQKEVLALKSQYERFINHAIRVYLQQLDSPGDPALQKKAHILDRKAMTLLSGFTRLATDMSELVEQELQAMNSLFRQNHQSNLIIFIAVILVSSVLATYILTTSIIHPLKKAIQLANQMAAGDLSQKMDQEYNDEFGDLAQSLNSMARQLDNHYQELEQAVEEKTNSLQKTNKDLVQEIEHRKDTQHELLGAMELAEKANHTKSTFLAMMSHELRTPMNGIIGMSSLALDTALNDTHRRYLTTIRNSAENLLTILNDILDFSKMEADNLQLDIIDFEPRKIMDETSELLTMRAQAKGLEFFTLIDPLIPEWLQGDPNRLRQVLINLAGNAIKFTETGQVAVRLELVDSTEKRVTIRFAVSDTGIGIPSQQLSSLFEPFTQGDTSTTRKFGGTGLGLSISKRLVELMGGTIMVESSEGAGSTFSFAATFGISEQAARPDSIQPHRSLVYSEGRSTTRELPPFWVSGKQILVADDDTVNTVVAEAILESFGCQVDSAHTGSAALELLQSTDYDLILMDDQMPELTGIEATLEIKEWANSPDKELQTKSRIPIIAITADSSEGARQKYLAAGMVDYINKPLRPEALARCLKKWLPSPQGQDKADRRALQFSRERLLQRLGGDEQKLQDTILAARMVIPRHLAELDMACANNNCKQANNTCQDLKRLGANLGIARLQHQALHLCMAMESDDREQVRDHYEKLKGFLTDLLDELHQE